VRRVIGKRWEEGVAAVSRDAFVGVVGKAAGAPCRGVVGSAEGLDRMEKGGQLVVVVDVWALGEGLGDRREL